MTEFHGAVESPSVTGRMGGVCLRYGRSKFLANQPVNVKFL